MFYGPFPPWAACLIALAIVALIALVVCAFLLMVYRVTWRYYLVMGGLALIGALSITFASIQAYNSQVAVYNMAHEQGLGHVDSIDGVTSTLHAYNSTGNCYVYAVYDPYQQAVVLDRGHIRNGTISLNGSTVYTLTTKPLTQEGINQVCEANYGEQAFNNNDE